MTVYNPFQLKNNYNTNNRHSLPFCSPNSKQFLPHYNEMYLPCTLMTSTKPQASTVFRSIIQLALQLTAVTLCQTNILEQHKLLY